MTLPIGHFAEAYASPIPYPDFYSKGPALCTQLDSELYFPEGAAARSDTSAALMKLCQDCPYKAECLEWALVNREDGIWGGTNNYMRSAMRKGVRSRTDVLSTRSTGATKDYTRAPKPWIPA